MARTPSTMLALGTPAPDYALQDAASGQTVERRDAAGKPLLVMFICNHCPFVIHVMDTLVPLANEYTERGVAVVAINSNDIASHPQDGPTHMKALAERDGFRFPFLFDATQAVAKAYRAACTPDFFLFDADHRLFYRGQMDDSRPGSGVPVTGQDLRAALDAALAGAPTPSEQRPSLGCNIKWKLGCEPSYFG